jgi:hypothetical protein
LSARLDWNNTVTPGFGSNARPVIIGGLAIMTDKRSANYHNDVGRYPILDSLLFLLAFRVVMDRYYEFPLFANAESTMPAVWLLSHSYTTIVWDAFAVMGFLSFRVFAFIFHSEMGRPCLSRESTLGAAFESTSVKNP